MPTVAVVTPTRQKQDEPRLSYDALGQKQNKADTAVSMSGGKADDMIADDSPTNEAVDTDQEDGAHNDKLLLTQLLVCLFMLGILYFAWRQGGALWGQMSRQISKWLEEGISFSGAADLTRFTDEVRDFWGRLVQAFAPVQG